MKVSACLLGFCLAASVSAQGNEQTFYNASLFSQTTATRATTGSVDQIYFTQPVDFRRGNGKATGWRVVLQDQNPTTAEAVRLSYHNLDFASIVPQKPEVFGADFLAFGGSTTGPKSYIYTFTVASSFAVPEFAALGIRLPAPVSWPADACTLHCQRGDRTQVSTAKRMPWTYKLSGTFVVPEWRDGTTFRFGGMYETAVLQVFNGSNAYSAGGDDLYGPESVVWESGGSRVDSLGFRAEGGAKYATVGDQLGLCAIFYSASYRSSPLPIPPFGTLLIDEGTATFLAYIITDTQGKGRKLTVPVPPSLGFSIAWQGWFVAIDTNLNQLNNFELSNAVRTIFP